MKSVLSQVGICILILSFHALAATSDHSSSVAAITGQFTFDESGRPCYQIVGAALKRIKKLKYQCNLGETLKTGAGKPYIRCTSGDGQKSLQVFKTKALCDDESQDQGVAD